MPSHEPTKPAHTAPPSGVSQAMPLPQAFAELAERQPAPRLQAQLARRLQQAAAEEETTASVLPWQRRWVWVVMPIAAAGALAAATAVLHRVEEKEAKLYERSQALHVALGEDGEHEVELDLQLGLHGDDAAELHIDAPHGLSVRQSVGASDAGPAAPSSASPRCDATHCTYAFGSAAKGKSAAQRVHIGVDKPGSYRIRARHQSQKASVREHFDLNVRP